jgi:hypothetical protein
LGALDCGCPRKKPIVSDTESSFDTPKKVGVVDVYGLQVDQEAEPLLRRGLGLLDVQSQIARRHELSDPIQTVFAVARTDQAFDAHPRIARHIDPSLMPKVITKEFVY